MCVCLHRACGWFGSKWFPYIKAAAERQDPRGTDALVSCIIFESHARISGNRIRTHQLVAKIPTVEVLAQTLTDKARHLVPGIACCLSDLCSPPSGFHMSAAAKTVVCNPLVVTT